MPLNLQGLTKNDFPRAFKEKNQIYYIPTELPPKFNSKKKYFKGGNNYTYIVVYNNKKYLYRESLCKYSKVIERDMYYETILSITMSILKVSPKIYGYGFDSNKLKYWSLHELFDCNLAQFIRTHSDCSKIMNKIEKQLLYLFAKLTKNSFCYDIHPKNVVVKVNKNKFTLKLIDFDAKYCTLKKPGGLSNKELIYATCIVFSNNFSAQTCKKHIYFQYYLRKYYNTVNIKKVLRFLKNLKANDPSKKFSCFSNLIYWRGSSTNINHILKEIMYGKLVNGYIVLPKKKKN